MTTSQEEYNEFGRDPERWEVCAIKWIFENPDFRFELVSRIEIKDPAQERETSEALERVEAPDLEAAIAAAHAMIDEHARKGGDIGFEIWIAPPKHPYPGQEELGVPHYKLAAEARKQARAIGIRGGDLEARIARMVRHAAPSSTRSPTSGIAASSCGWRTTP
jgi:hypothetical protein